VTGSLHTESVLEAAQSNWSGLGDTIYVRSGVRFEGAYQLSCQEFLQRHGDVQENARAVENMVRALVWDQAHRGLDDRLLTALSDLCSARCYLASESSSFYSCRAVELLDRAISGLFALLSNVRGTDNLSAHSESLQAPIAQGRTMPEIKEN
jgi:hypothetical protein